MAKSEFHHSCKLKYSKISLAGLLSPLSIVVRGGGVGGGGLWHGPRTEKIKDHGSRI